MGESLLGGRVSEDRGIGMLVPGGPVRCAGRMAPESRSRDIPVNLSSRPFPT